MSYLTYVAYSVLLPRFFSGCGMRGSFSGPVSRIPEGSVLGSSIWCRCNAGVLLSPYTCQELLGLGLILGALYLQGRIEREKIWGSEGMLQRFLGSVPISRANKK